MKAKLTGKITTVSKCQNIVNITASFTGVVIDAPPNAKEISFEAAMSLKPLIADQLKIGSTLTIIVSDEEIVEK